MTTFQLEESYLKKFQPRRVGASSHMEYWIPAEDLSAFNEAIDGPIRLKEGFFGAAFTGYVPDAYGLKRKDAVSQFVALSKTWEYSTFDVACAFEE